MMPTKIDIILKAIEEEWHFIHIYGQSQRA